ncbi:MAG: hypothetical protein NTZ58_01625 [Solirubrobacterales bacterium]|nr:hypothetical protein [Solirubrobacterales bacterium]
MGKTLIIAEKPSVGEDLARVLPGPFKKKAGTGEKRSRALEGPDHIISWAVGHLVSLADPDQYDEKFKKWRLSVNICAAMRLISSSTPVTLAAKAS